MDVQTRLVELRREMAEGERALAELDQRRERLVASMLRIAGAVQVLEELAAGATPGAAPPEPVDAGLAGAAQA